MDPECGPPAALSQRLQKHLAVPQIKNDALLALPTTHHMIDRSLVLDSHASWHAWLFTSNTYSPQDNSARMPGLTPPRHFLTLQLTPYWGFGSALSGAHMTMLVSLADRPERPTEKP